MDNVSHVSAFNEELYNRQFSHKRNYINLIDESFLINRSFKDTLLMKLRKIFVMIIVRHWYNNVSF